jgi:uncharacterized membrane protein YhaH (DUF805 family)
VSFQEAVGTVLRQKYATFHGRARRSEFWFFVLFSAIARTIADVIDAVIHTGNSTTGGLVSTLVELALLVPTLAVGARRLHDTGRSGWWWLIALIPFVGIIVLIVFWVQDSRGDNQYGPNPKGLGGAEQGYGLGYRQGYGGYGPPPPPPPPEQGYGSPSYGTPGTPPYGTPGTPPYGTPPPGQGRRTRPPSVQPGQDEPPTTRHLP